MVRNSNFFLAALIFFNINSLVARAAHENDAPLRASQFVDKNEGWAVGDHGLILHSIDGGKSWEPQASGSTASLRGVCFLTPYTGWAVGRSEIPNAVGSVGVILRTTDGGLNWSEIHRIPVLPGLQGVRFFDENTGVVWGDGADTLASGLFHTSDGGKTWASVAGFRAGSWLCGSFHDIKNGIVVGKGNAIATVRDGRTSPIQITGLNGRSLRGLAMNAKAGVLVGDGGFIALTNDGGEKWTPATLPLSNAAAFSWDFRSVSRAGDTVVAVGSPGSVIARSVDGGQSWKVHKTGWRTPLHAVQMLSENLGWAVGDFGVVLGTTDGGQTWTRLRQGASKAAVLFVNAKSKSMPVDVVAALGEKDGYHCVGLAVCGPTAEDDKNRFQDEFRLEAAIRAAGGTAAETAWAFAQPSYHETGTKADLLAYWNRQLRFTPAKSDQPAPDRLACRLALAYRMWQPEVVICEELELKAGPAEQLVLMATQAAAEVAGNAREYPEQIEELGLGATSVKKLYAPASAPKKAENLAIVSLDTNTFDKLLFDTPRGFAEPALGLLAANQPLPRSRNFRLVSHGLAGSEKHTALMEGTVLAVDGPSRRAATKETGGDFLSIERTRRDRAVARRKQLEAIADVERYGQSGITSAVRAAVDEKIQGEPNIPPEFAERTVLAIARQMNAQGNSPVAREIHEIAATRFEATSGGLEALRWLALYQASGEFRIRSEHDGRLAVAKVPQPLPAGIIPIAAQELPPADPMDWPRKCLEMEARIAAHGPIHVRDPRLVLSALAARRTLGMTADAGKVVDAYFRTHPAAATQTPGEDLWRDCLAAEAWIRDPSAIKVQPKPVALCPKTSSRPHLDGRLDDDCWKAFTPLDLSSTTGDLAGYRTEVFLAHDDEFFYVAARCTHPEGRNLPKAEKRRRDDDLTGRDRIDVLIDLDRDYSSYFRLSVDQRGCVADDCTGDVTWNPKWFVAVDPTPTGWTLEAAIPLGEFVHKTPSAGTTWAANAVRVIPGVGVQSWTGPASATPRPEGMGLLKFHPGLVK